ncbi:hypothetical protein B0H10DRAFT_2236165 [Mycena sp. CBHHK59/15]|nr:hypothetical protein B0H10DRAFT_2236165 [Mycena sp. CBHHK59/15]
MRWGLLWPNGIDRSREARNPVTLPLPDSHLPLNRSPLKDARLAQRNYRMEQKEPVPVDADTDDEILLSPGKNRDLNSRITTNSKRSASPPPQDEYSNSAAPNDGRELKRLKRDTEEGGSDIENTDTNIRSTATPMHTRNLSEPVVGGSRKSSKPHSAARQTPASLSSKGRARSVPVFPVLDLSNPPTTPWRRRARSRSPSKDRELPKLQIIFTSLTSIPDEAGPSEQANVPPPLPPSVSLPTLPTEPDPVQVEPPPMPPPVIIDSPSTPVHVSNYNRVFATPMSPLTPLPETPRPFQVRLGAEDGYTQRTTSRGSPRLLIRIYITIFSYATAPSPPPFVDTTAESEGGGEEKPPAPEPPVPATNTEIRETAEASRNSKAPAHSRLPRPAATQSMMGPLPVLVASNSNSNGAASKKAAAKGAAKSMGPPPVPLPSSSTSTSTPSVNAFNVMMAASARSKVVKGKGKGKEKEKPTKELLEGAGEAPAQKDKGKGKEKPQEKPQEEKKVSVKAKMRPREKPKPVPLPIHVRLPDESDGDLASTPTVSRPDTPMAAFDIAVVGPTEEMPLAEAAASLPSALVDEPDVPELDPPPVDVDEPLPPPSSSPDMPLSPAAEAEVDLPELPAEPPAAETVNEDRDKPKTKDVEMPTVPVDEHVAPADTDVSMSADQGTKALDVKPLLSPEPKGRPKPRVGKARGPAALPAPADRVTRSASLKRKEAEGSGAAPTHKKSFSFGVGALQPEGGNPAKKQKTNDDAPSHSQAGPSRSPTKIPMASFANPTKASAARAAVTKTPARAKPMSAAGAPSGSPSPTKNKLVRASSLFTARPPPSFTRTFTGPGGSTSSLQTLASALEKLRMPPPARPNTSMGFSRDDTDSSLAESTRSADERSIGMGRPPGLQRAATVASLGSSSSTSSITDEPSTAAAPPPKLVQRPLSAFMGPGKGANGTSRLLVGTGSILRGGPSIFGGATRGRSAPKVSRNPGLPSVMGSPVKGGGDGDTTMIEEDQTEGVDGSDEGKKDTSAADQVTSPRGVTFDFSGLIEFEGSKKGKEKERLPEEWRKNASRRASMAGQDLSNSVSLPPKPLMGPPENPAGHGGMRSTSSSYPSSSSDLSGSEGMRRSTRIATVGTALRVQIPPLATMQRLQRHSAPPTLIQPLTTLKGCIVFVDIISDIGDNSARSFITDMLKNLGARVLGSVGQTCTHIVYKNGLRSTYTRYRALPDPKPHVVGMEWVVQSAEKRKHEDETPYLIDMDDMNTTATSDANLCYRG